MEINEIVFQILKQSEPKTLKCLWCVNKKFWNVYNTPFFKISYAKYNRDKLSFNDLIRLLEISEDSYNFCYDKILNFIDYEEDKIPVNFSSLLMLRDRSKITTLFNDIFITVMNLKFYPLGLIKMFISQGADINLTNTYGCTLLHIAVLSKRIDIVKNAITDTNINLKDIYGESPLFKAAMCGYHKIGEELIKHGADVNLINLDTQSPLMAASRSNKPKMIELLLKNGADPNYQDSHKLNALINALKWKYHQTVSALIEGGADVNSKDNRDMTCLMIVCLSRDHKMIKLLVENGADVNSKLFDLISPLFFAAALQDKHTYNYLVSQGSDTSFLEINMSYIYYLSIFSVVLYYLSIFSFKILSSLFFSVMVVYRGFSSIKNYIVNLFM
jgi:ankyrin repeat protein